MTYRHFLLDLEGDYHTVGDGFTLLATLAGWNYAVDRMTFHFGWAARLLEPPTEVLVRHGRPNQRVLRREMLSIDELRSKLREKGVTTLKQVRIARLEPDGSLSVVKYDEH